MANELAIILTNTIADLEDENRITVEERDLLSEMVCKLKQFITAGVEFSTASNQIFEPLQQKFGLYATKEIGPSLFAADILAQAVNNLNNLRYGNLYQLPIDISGTYEDVIRWFAKTYPSDS